MDSKLFWIYFFNIVTLWKQETMRHRTKRIRWWRVEKFTKSLVYKELCVVWRLRLHKTKRLHWFNFGLHRRAFRLHEAGERFTYIGLHVYACGLFATVRWNPLYTGISSVQGLYIRLNLNRVRMILKCVYKDGIIRMGITFFSRKISCFFYSAIRAAIRKWY